MVLEVFSNLNNSVIGLPVTCTPLALFHESPSREGKETMFSDRKEDR